MRQLAKKKTVVLMTSRNEDIPKELEKLGKKLYSEIEDKVSPTIEIPVRGYANVAFNEKKRLIELGSKILKRTYINTAHTRKFMQTALVAGYCYDVLFKTKGHCSQRDLFYALKRTLPKTNINTFDEQRESDPCIVDLEVSLGTMREGLRINAAPKGRVVGPATIIDSGDTINWDKMGSGGWAIPSNVEEIKFKDIGADFILAIEKDAGFDRLNEDKFWKTHNCLVLTSGGQFSRGARRIIQRIHAESKIPVYVVTDSDGYGWYIYSVIKFGSMALAHTSDMLGTPDAKFIGLTLTDVEHYGLQKQLIKAEQVDLKRTKEIMAYDWFKVPAWQKELKKAIESEKKAEIEALTAKGLRFLTKTYLPEKIEKKDFLP